MSLYPSLEDMKVDHMIQQQVNVAQRMQQNHFYPPNANAQPGAYPNLTSGEALNSNVAAYPDLHDFMGMELSKEIIAANMPEYLVARNNQTVQPYSAPTQAMSGMIAPLSGNTVGLLKAQVTHGIRQLILCKGADKKIGLRVQTIDKGIFVCLVVKDSPAAIAGLRFGDQILQINETLVAGLSVDNVLNIFKKCDVNDISVVVRDRPFERTITLHRDSKGNPGFQFHNGKITNIFKDSTAARNGLLIDHYLLEVDGQNVVGMKDKDIQEIINKAPPIITITILPKFIYDHMMKKLSTSWIRGIMDHSVPEL